MTTPPNQHIMHVLPRLAVLAADLIKAMEYSKHFVLHPANSNTCIGEAPWQITEGLRCSVVTSIRNNSQPELEMEAESKKHPNATKIPL